MLYFPDLEISGSLFPEDSKDRTKSCCVMEESVAERYKNQKSEQNKKMRKELQKVFLSTYFQNIFAICSSKRRSIYLFVSNYIPKNNNFVSRLM